MAHTNNPNEVLSQLTAPQIASLDQLWEREQADSEPYWADRLTMYSHVQIGRDCAMIYWRNMWLGVELDGYRHS